MSTQQTSDPRSWGDPRKGKGTTSEPKLVLKRREKVVRFPTGNPFYCLEEEGSDESLGEMSSQSAHTAATA